MAVKVTCTICRKEFELAKKDIEFDPRRDYCNECAFAKDWKRKCEVCGQRPVVKATGLCGPCTFGEAETQGGNW